MLLKIQLAGTQRLGGNYTGKVFFFKELSQSSLAHCSRYKTVNAISDAGNKAEVSCRAS